MSLLTPVLLAALSAAPAPYSLPWQLRPVVAGTGVRSDTSLALLGGPEGPKGTSLVTFLSGSYKVMPGLAPFVRLGIVNQSPATGTSTTAFVNPALGANYAMP